MLWFEFLAVLFSFARCWKSIQCTSLSFSLSTSERPSRVCVSMFSLMRHEGLMRGCDVCSHLFLLVIVFHLIKHRIRCMQTLQWERKVKKTHTDLSLSLSLESVSLFMCERRSKRCSNLTGEWQLWDTRSSTASWSGREKRLDFLTATERWNVCVLGEEHTQRSHQDLSLTCSEMITGPICTKVWGKIRHKEKDCILISLPTRRSTTPYLVPFWRVHVSALARQNISQRSLYVQK